MAMFLNTPLPYKRYKKISETTYFVDKSLILNDIFGCMEDQDYTALAYITGILPISKYSSGSELNMFMEFKMTSMEAFSEYFGFTDEEVDILYEKYTHLSSYRDQIIEKIREESNLYIK